MKNINIVNKIVAKKLNRPLNEVAAVNSFYWKVSKEKLINCEPTTIFWKHLGSITISKHKLYNEIKRLISKIKLTRKSEKYVEEKRLRIIAYHKVRLTALLKHRNIIAKDEYDKGIYVSPNGRNKKLEEDPEGDMD